MELEGGKRERALRKECWVLKCRKGKVLWVISDMWEKARKLGGVKEFCDKMWTRGVERQFSLSPDTFQDTGGLCLQRTEDSGRGC